MSGRLRTRAAGFLVILVSCFVAAPGYAADPPFKEEGIQYLPAREPYIEWLIGTAIVLACVGLAFKNPHRLHGE